MSSHRGGQRPIPLRPLVPEAREAVAQHVERILGSDWRLSHRFMLSRDEKAVATETYYAWKREGRERPGLLILTEEFPPVYWDMDRDQPYSIRFQIPFGFLRNGTHIFSVTLLRGEKRMIFEDVIAADGVKLFRSVPYSARWAKLVASFTAFTAQQLFLGFTLVLVEPVCLQTLIDSPPQPGTIWDFQPESASRIRLYWICPGARVDASAGAKARAAEATAHLKLPAEVNKNILKRGSAVPTIRVAFAEPDRTLIVPDNYILTSSDDQQIGRASVSKLDKSIQLRAAFSKPDSPTKIPVEVAWNIEFNKYEIIRIMIEGTPVMSYSNFYEKNATI